MLLGRFVEDIFTMSSSPLVVEEAHCQPTFMGQSASGRVPMKTASWTNSQHDCSGCRFALHVPWPPGNGTDSLLVLSLSPEDAMATNFELLRRIPSSRVFFH